MLNWLKMFNFINMTTFACRLLVTLKDIGLYTNSWIMCFVSIERAISVCVPHKVRLVCTINRARCINIFLWLLCIVIFSIYSQIYIAESGDLWNKCFILESYILIGNIHTIANIFVQFLLPYAVILGSSIIIVVKCIQKQ